MEKAMERLYAAALEVRGIRGQSELARALGTTPQTIYNWEKRGISKEGMLTAQKVLGVSASWIETGVLPKFVRDVSNVSSVTVGTTRIPLISFVQAGMWTDVMDLHEPGFADEFLLTDMELSSGAFALEIKGDSMLPQFKEGDRVIIDPEIAPAPGDFVVAKNGLEEATFKKYRPRGIGPDGNMIFELIPLNDDYPSMRSDAQPIRIIGTMVEHRQYRKRQ